MIPELIPGLVIGAAIGIVVGLINWAVIHANHRKADEIRKQIFGEEE